MNESSAPTTVGPARQPWREIARVASAVVVVVTLVALAIMAIVAGRSDRAAPAVTRAPRTVPAGARAAPPVTRAVDVRPATSPAPRPARSLAPPAAVPTTVPPPPVAAAPAPAPPAAPDATKPPPVRECALGLPPPAPGGGVASLTPLVPFFGPFSAEAFTMMPAFEPAFPMFAPMLFASEPLLAQADPLLSAIAPPAQEFEQAGFDLLAPLYAPQRQSFLDAEAAFAASVAPLAESLAAAPGTECVIALEGMLAALVAPA